MGKKMVHLKIIKLYFAPFLLFILLIAPVFAGDVAYIYRKSFRIDNIIIETFQDLGFSVEKIQEDRIPSDLSKYRLIFLGDENFKNINKIKDIIAENPSIIVNSYHGKELGLTDNEGVSQLGSSGPLSVLKNGNLIQAYTSESGHRGMSVNYLYLDTLNKAPSLKKIASTEPTSSGYKFGDVIACGSTGSLLMNGKVAKKNLCFFGIAESDFWTSSARKLFEETVNFVAITCSSDSQCPIGISSKPFCSQNSLSVNQTSYICENPGELNSRCTLSTERIVKEQCIFGCQNNKCQESKHDVSLIDFINSINKIRIENSEGMLIEDNNLKCNEKYKISVSVKNSGDHFENVTFLSTLDSLSFNHLPISNMEPGDTSLKSKTVNITLSEGFYRINIKALINKDENLLDNSAQREVFVSCSTRFIVCSLNTQCNDNNPLTFDECINSGTEASLCRNTEINCASNSDCGATGFIGTEFCSEKNVVKNYQTSKCINAGTKDSFCSTSISPKEVVSCSITCSSGICVQCRNDLDCNDSDSGTKDICNNAGSAESYCSHTTINEQITCRKNSDCGLDGFIDSPFCSGNNVAQKFNIYTCNNAGTTQSSCSSSITEKVKEQCTNECLNSLCVDQTPGKHDVSLIDISGGVNRIKIENESGDLVSSEELKCNEKYKIIVKVKNSGEFYENVSFSGNIGSLLFSHVPIQNLAPSGTSEKTRTVNITLAEGTYTIRVGANIPKDDNEGDNIVQRDIKVVCKATEPSVHKPFCIDSDNGKDFGTKGNVSYLTKVTITNGSIQNPGQIISVTYGASTSFDYCIDSSTVIEYSCFSNETGSFPSSVRYKCPFGCENSVCRDSSISLQNLSSCSVLNIPNMIYKLNRNVYAFNRNNNIVNTCFIIKADNVTFDGSGFKVVGEKSHFNYGITTEKVKNATIKNVLIEDFYYGIFLNDTDNSFIDNSIIQQNFNGIYLTLSSNNKIANSIVNNNTYSGIVVFNGSNLNTITRNKISDHSDGDGILIEKSIGNNINDNKVERNLQGIDIFDKSSGNNINKNTIGKNGNGIAIYLSLINVASDNLIRENDLGLIIEGGAQNTIKRNTFFQNKDKDISLQGNTKGNFVEGNFFL
ncbi:right-handed parallel beta-helix repeat-containing protein [Candidatus Pacearchaeota archaeon]|nr:right-handed parallel beta-helix repeat-containing protein [Candidatus Pacearchaeota archaeon]